MEEFFATKLKLQILNTAKIIYIVNIYKTDGLRGSLKNTKNRLSIPVLI